ncbi:MAG: T9SS type A sorting domain-containing protein [Saprospiraceae bacterium]|nr:T9SS type A sorting domain-containing protein [Candidatus Opimibacter iunctus]
MKDAALDNSDAANWQICGASTGVIINGFEVKGTPGALNSGGGTAGPAVTIAIANFKFTPKEVVVAVGETVRWVNAEAISHNVNGSQATYPNNPESFVSGAPAPGLWQFDYIPLTAGLYDYRCDPHFSGGMVGTVSVYDPLSYTDFALPRLRLTNENGSALYDGVPTTVTGVVHGVNYQPTGYSFVIDANNVGINVFSFDPGNYIVTSGDRVKVSGVIDQFNGLLEIIPDTIELLSTLNGLNTPRNVNEIKEVDEGSYLYTAPLVVDSVSNISATGYTIYTTHQGGAKISVRVDADANIPFGPEEFSQGSIIQAEGFGTQFDNSFPFTSGYQLLASQISAPEGIQFLESAAIRMEPNPAFESIHLSSDLMLQRVEIYSLDGRHLLDQEVNNTETEIGISHLPAGLHIVKAVTDQGIWTSRLSVVR